MTAGDKGPRGGAVDPEASAPIRHTVAGIWCVTIPADEYDALRARGADVSGDVPRTTEATPVEMAQREAEDVYRNGWEAGHAAAMMSCTCADEYDALRARGADVSGDVPRTAEAKPRNDSQLAEVTK